MCVDITTHDGRAFPCVEGNHITRLLSQLHWLPIEAHIRHMIAVMTFKAVSTGKPSYLAELVHKHTPAREIIEIQFTEA